MGCVLFRPHSLFKSVERYFEFPKSDKIKCLNPSLGPSLTPLTTSIWYLKMKMQSYTVQTPQRNTKISTTSLVFHGRARRQTLNPILHLWDELGDEFETGSQPCPVFTSFTKLYWRSGTGYQAHETSDFHYQQAPSCYSTEGMIHAIFTGRSRVFCDAI